jgi:hypothetical protein
MGFIIMLTQEQVASFDRNGFLNGGKILSDSESAELKKDLMKLIDHGPDGFAPDEARPVLFRNLSGNDDAPVWQIVNIWEACPSFERLLYHPAIVNAISQLTKMRDLQVWHDQVQYKPSGKGGMTFWHQDAPLWPAIKPLTPVSAWIPLEDATEENGCMWMIPGSHKWGNCLPYFQKLGQKLGREFFDIDEDFQAPAEAPLREVKPVVWPVKKGEVSFHHSLTWHGSPNNKSNKPRPAIAIHYMTSEAQFVSGSKHPMSQFVNLPDGAPMAQAGAHFPAVCRDGKPVPAPTIAIALR